MDKNTVLSHLRALGYVPAEPSLRKRGETIYVIADNNGKKELLLAGHDNPSFEGRQLPAGEVALKVCPLTAANAAALRTTFPFTAPVSLAGKSMSIGLGDRLGLVTGAHIKALEGSGMFPVLAQQSKRELTLTGRTNRSMLDDVAWQVFESGYEGGYAADGDHLKTVDEVAAAVADGDTMITLDCSEHIHNEATSMTAQQVCKQCAETFDKAQLSLWEQLYSGKTVSAGAHSITFSPEEMPVLYLLYGEAIAFARQVYQEVIRPCGHHISLEISIDETETETSPAAHYFVAAELLRLGVAFESMAPRFCGEFQKGVDYMGDLHCFEAEFAIHAAIARQLGYRISVHSGSDKFSVFPIVYRLSGGVFHLKTSGTSWVEAVRVIARHEPTLFRRMLYFSCEKYPQAKQFYHVSGRVEEIPDVENMADAALPALLDQISARQVMHITYGYLLQEKRADGSRAFRDDIYRVLRTNKESLDATITAHIRRHLTSLGCI